MKTLLLTMCAIFVCSGCRKIEGDVYEIAPFFYGSLNSNNTITLCFEERGVLTCPALNIERFVEPADSPILIVVDAPGLFAFQLTTDLQSLFCQVNVPGMPTPPFKVGRFHRYFNGGWE